jgi:hypothetical protein
LWLPYFKCLYCTDCFWKQEDKYLLPCLSVCTVLIASGHRRIYICGFHILSVYTVLIASGHRRTNMWLPCLKCVHWLLWPQEDKYVAFISGMRLTSHNQDRIQVKTFFDMISPKIKKLVKRQLSR